MSKPLETTILVEMRYPRVPSPACPAGEVEATMVRIVRSYESATRANEDLELMNEVNTTAGTFFNLVTVGHIDS